MSVFQRPSYDALEVILQVWHYNTGGRNTEFNEGLAKLFGDANLQNWKVIPSPADGVIDASCHDQFVPVEVRFCHRTRAYNDPGEHAMADVRKLFFGIASLYIYRYFIQIGSAPHAMNIYPVRASEAFRPRYTHGYNLNPLGIRVKSFLVPGPANTEDAQAWLRDAINGAEDGVKILASLVTVYNLYQGRGTETKRDFFQRLARDPEALNLHVPERLRSLFDRYRGPNREHDARESPQTADIQAAFDGATHPLTKYLRLANIMDKRLKMLEDRKTLSNQDLYELVQDVRDTALHVSSLKKAPFIETLEENYNEVIKQYKSGRNKTAVTSGITTGAIGGVAAYFWWHPAGLAVLGSLAIAGAGTGAGAVGAGTAVVVHQKLAAEKGKAFGKMDGVRDFRIAIKAVDDSSNQAREAMAMIFSSQVLRIKLDGEFPEHDRRRILASLGVDVDAISSFIYNEELMKDRLRTFRENNDRMRETLGRVLEDNNLEWGNVLEGSNLEWGNRVAPSLDG